MAEELPATVHGWIRLAANALSELMTREEATALVCQSIDDLVAREPQLLDLDVSERALSHHLALCIAHRVSPPFCVDCEYNRHHRDPKRLNLPPREALDREIRATTVFPDIIVHQRGTDAHNLVVLELKKPGEATDYDELKLLAFLRELGYRHAGHIILGRAADGNLVRELRWVDG
jgi:hypothetical protein